MEWIRERLPTIEDANERKEVLMACWNYEYEYWYSIETEYYNFINEGQWWYPLCKVGFPPNPPS